MQPQLHKQRFISNAANLIKLHVIFAVIAYTLAPKCSPIWHILSTPRRGVVFDVVGYYLLFFF